MAKLSPDARRRLETFKAVKVKHPHLEEVDRLVTQAIEEHAGYTHLLVYGPTGVGKSTVTSRIAERFVREETNRTIVPVVWVEARPSDTGVYARLDYYRQVLSSLREHAAVKDRLMQLALAPRAGRRTIDAAEWLDMREAVEYAFERLQVRAVVVDEAQHLMQVQLPLRPVDQLDWLKSLTNHTQVLHVLVGPYELYDFRNLNGQAARRGRDIHFPRYHLEKQEECIQFVGALQYFLSHVPLACDVPSLMKEWRWFAQWSVGCVGILRDWLVETVADLLAQGSTILTREALQVHALSPGQRVRLEMEARSGEEKVERGNESSSHQLQQLLSPPSSEVGQLRASGRVGDRAPARDPVGADVFEDLAPKCPGSGTVLDLEVIRFTQSAIASIECEKCGRVWKVTPKKNGLVYPSHDKLRTKSSHTGPRWIKRDGAWTPFVPT